MKQFMAMLNKNENEDPPPTKLLDLAGQLCQNLQSSSPSLEKLVKAVMRCKNKRHFLTNIHVVRACVSVHIHNGQHDTACRLLEYCKAEEKEELVQLWHEIHYRRVMEKHQTDSLTPLQKFRCRKRNPPPISLCPEGLKNRNYSEAVRQHLHRFAAEVTVNPDKKQREGLARDMNLQPTQVYNWFANYRRRQKSRLLPKEKLNNLCPEGALTSYTNEPQDKGFHTPQTAGGSHVDISPEQTGSVTLCEPGWEQLAAPVYEPPEGIYVKMLESSSMQSTELYEVGTSTALFPSYKAEQPVPFRTEAVVEPATCFGSPVPLPGEAASSPAASSQQGSFVRHSYYESPPFPNDWLPKWQAPYSTSGVSGSMWTPGVEGIRVPLSTVPQGGYVEASSGRIIQQSDLEVESFTLRGGQLGTLESIPHRPLFLKRVPEERHLVDTALFMESLLGQKTVFGKPQCPPVSAPCVEESQALGQSQCDLLGKTFSKEIMKSRSPYLLASLWEVAAALRAVLEDPVGDSLTNDMLQAVRLLFEFSANGRM